MPNLSDQDLLEMLEAISRDRYDRVVRLMGTVASGMGDPEPLEILVFRGFSSCTTHATAQNPDLSVIPEGARLLTAELLSGPLLPGEEEILLGPLPPVELLDRERWDRLLEA